MIESNRFRWSQNDIHQLVEQQAKQAGKKLTETAIVKIELPKPQRGEKFIRGPIPVNWIQAAIPYGRKSYNVALALWYLAGFKQSAVVKLTRATLAEFGVSAESARSILKGFERAGLVYVNRKRGRSPIVTIRATNNKTGDQ